MAINLVKMPLIRVAHPSQDECQAEFKRIKGQLGASIDADKLDDDLDLRPGRLVDDDGAPPVQYPPSLFNFEHHYDKELAPVTEWKKQVSNISSLLDYEKEKTRQLEKEKLELKQELESEIVKLASELRESQGKASSWHEQLEAEREVRAKSERQLQKMQEQMDRMQRDHQDDKARLEDQMFEA